MQHQLITEVEDFEIQAITESKDGSRGLWVEGIALQADVINGNRRVYPKAVMQESIDEYIRDYVEQSQALGECDHPPRAHVELKEASHLIESLHWNGNDVEARAKILGTPNGLTVRALIEGGWKPRVSSRGTGTTRMITESKSKYGTAYNEVTRFKITAAFDFVLNQSAPGAAMAGVYEQNGFGVYVPVAETQQESVDWDKVAYKFKHLLGVSKPLIIESETDELNFSVHGGQLVIACNTNKWEIPLKEMKKFLG